MSTVGSSLLLLVALGIPTVLANLGLRHRRASVVAKAWTVLLGLGALLFGLSVLLLVGMGRALPHPLNPVVPAAAFAVATVLLMLLVPCAVGLAFSERARRLVARRLPSTRTIPSTRWRWPSWSSASRPPSSSRCC